MALEPALWYYFSICSASSPISSPPNCIQSSHTNCRRSISHHGLSSKLFPMLGFLVSLMNLHSIFKTQLKWEAFSFLSPFSLLPLCSNVSHHISRHLSLQVSLFLQIPIQTHSEFFKGKILLVFILYSQRLGSC